MLEMCQELSALQLRLKAWANVRMQPARSLQCGPIFLIFLVLAGLASPVFSAEQPLTIYTELSFRDSFFEELDGQQVVAGFATA